MSSFGDGCQQIAMTWMVYHLTGNALSIGISLSLYYLPSILLSPFLSVLVDLRDSKLLAVSTDVFRFLLVGSISILLLFGRESINMLYFLQVLLAIAYTLYKPAAKSLIKESFQNRDLAFVSAKSASLNESAFLIGLGMAGFLITSLSLAICFILNALTFAFPAVLFSLIKRLDKKAVTLDKIHYFSSFKEGLTYIKKTQGMGFLIFLSILNSIMIQMATTVFLPLARELNGGSELYSAFEMSFSIGAVISGLFVTYFMKKWNNRLLLVTITGMMAATVLMALNHQPILMILLIFGLGYFAMTHLVTTQTIIQILSPKEMVGRVFGLRAVIASIVKISSALTTGLLITKIPLSNVLILFGILMLLSLLSFKKVRKIEFGGLGI